VTSKLLGWVEERKNASDPDVDEGAVFLRPICKTGKVDKFVYFYFVNNETERPLLTHVNGTDATKPLWVLEWE